MKKFFSHILFIGISISSFAQAPSLSGAEILQAMKKLNTVGSVLYIAAHPDDENTRLLGYLAAEKKFRTGYLSLTRGDGGQNLVGKEQGEALGLIRTQELLAARRTDGAEQFFTRANDFGYSKNPEETFSFWNKDSILSDVVLCIRTFKPDVIICRFPTTGEGGHGHHTASAILAMEAFDAAADSTKFPAQLKYTDVWKTRRIFWNTFNFGGTNTTAADQIKVDVGVFNPLLGKGYGEIAAASRSMHKSQGFGSAAQRGSNIEYFKLLKGDAVKEDLFEDIGNSWKRIKRSEALQAKIADCLLNYRAADPASSIKDLVAIYKEIQKIEAKDAFTSYWKTQKLKETEMLILACSGLWLEASATQYIAIPGKEINLSAQIVNRSSADIRLNKLKFLNAEDTSMVLTLKNNELYTFKHKSLLPEKTPFSNPYWLNEKHETGMYTVNDRNMIGKPQNDPSCSMEYDLTIYDLNLKISAPVIYKSTDPVKGEIYRPLEVLPPATVNLAEKVIAFSNSDIKTIQYLVKANAANVKGSIEIKATEGWKAVVKEPSFNLINKGDEVLINVEISADKSRTSGKLHAFLKIDNNTYSTSIQRIEYDHIPYQVMLTEATAKLIYVEIQKAGINIGYIPGAGDDVPACLKEIGYNVTVLSDEQLSNADLSQYNAIVTGVRAYNTSERLQAHYEKLMSYVSNGGNLIVQYNTNNRIGPVLAKIGPYPFTISRERVTDEKAAVEFIDPSHPVLNFPNKISSSDFENWVQERGIYFAAELDPKYEKILRMNDPNEKSNEGSLIVAKHGKGNFVYTGLVFFRELPAGVPGAYRLFANLLSIPQNK
jgi:LmbE family N-acetylglucosaminyl deacetylase